MSILTAILCVLVIAIGAAIGAYWGAMLWHIWRTMRTIPTCRDGLRLPEAEKLKEGNGPRVCVVVPAHNEEGVVGQLAASLVGQDYGNVSVVFALDRCTDGTADEIRTATGGAEHVEILPIAECPPEWAGKVHAIWRAVSASAAARGAELLIFADADTAMNPACVRAAVALLRSRGLGMLSIVSTLTAERGFERVTQPAAGMELMRQYPLARANARTHRRAFANGQFILMTREAYEAIGGHEAVKGAVLEDIELARRAERKGVAAGLFFADDMLRCRMYASRAAFQEGWKRIYAEAANRRVSRLRTLALRSRVVGAAGPVALGCGVVMVAVLASVDGGEGWTGLHIAAAAVGALALLAYGAALVWSYRISRVPVLWALLYPVGAWQVADILASAAEDLRAGRPIRWAGREYVREAR